MNISCLMDNSAQGNLSFFVSARDLMDQVEVVVLNIRVLLMLNYFLCLHDDLNACINKLKETRCCYDSAYSRNDDIERLQAQAPFVCLFLLLLVLKHVYIHNDGHK